MREPDYAQSPVQIGDMREVYALLEENQGTVGERAAAIARRAELAQWRAEQQAEGDADEQA